MAIINFKKESQDKLSFILGSVETEEDTNRGSFVDSYVEKNYYKVTEAVIVEVEGEDDTTEYKATQVNPDGSVEENGIVFDSDETYTSNVNSPLYLPNLKINTTLFSGDVEVGKAYQVEEIDPDEFGEEPVYYIIPKGGGTSDFRLDMKSNTLTINTPIENGADIVTDLGELIEGNVTVIQRVFDTVQVYDEILYGYIDEEGYYCIDKSILGV